MDQPPREIGTAQVLGRTVRCVGEFDAANLEVLRSAFAEAARSGPGFAVDMTGVSFFESRTLSVIWEYLPHKPVVLVAAGSLMERVCHTIGLPGQTEVRSIEVSDS